MDSSQVQFADLRHQIETIHTSLDQLTLRFEEAIKEIRAVSQASNLILNGTASDGSQLVGSRGSRLTPHGDSLHHKDVLIDSDYSDSEFSKHEGEMAPDMQVRRLTAQLTAAYNRIASLEEQLLSQRLPASSVSLEAIERVG